MDKDPQNMTMDEAAAALEALLNGAEGAQPTETEAQVPDGVTATAEAAPTNPEVTTEQQVAVEEPPVEQQEEPAPTTVEVDATEARFAKLESELQRLRSENGRMRKVSADNAMLRRKLRSVTEAPPEQRARLADFDEEQQIALGDDVTEVLKSKLAQADEMIAAMDQRYQEQEAYLGEIRQREHKAKHEEMMDAVENQYGSEVWDMLETEAFHNWRETYDPLTGQQNGELLRKIDANADSEAAIAIMGNFLRYAGYKKAEQPAPTQVRNTPTSANMVQRPTEPRGQTAKPVAPQQGQKRNWTPQAINAAFARADRDPKWAQSAEGKAIFNEIMEAAIPYSSSF